MAKTTFTNGTVVTASFLNAINNPVFSSPADNDGEIPLITNDDLSDDAGQIKPEWTTFRDSFKVSAGTGLSAAYNGGIITLPAGTLVTVSPGTVSLTASTTNFVFIDTAGAVVSATTLPVIACVLASVVTSSGSVSTVSDLRPRFSILPRADAIKIFGGLGPEGDKVVTGTETLTRGEYYYKSLTVNSGATLTIDQSARIYCSGNVTINGTIIVTAASPGGPALSPFGALFPSIPGTGYGAGVYNNSGATYNYAVSPLGSGGATGCVSGSSGNTANTAKGGDGGGGLIIEAAGIISISGTIQVDGTAGASCTVVTGNPFTGGSGGGSGGLILLKSLSSISATGTAVLRARGGAGGNGTSNGSQHGSGGGGGGGGTIVLQAPSISNSGTTQVSGGAAGANGAGGAASVGGGGGGSFGGGGGQSGGNPTAGGAGRYITLSIKPVI